MNTKQIQKLVSRRLGILVGKLGAVQDEISSWEPGDDDAWILDEMVKCESSLAELIESIEEGAYDVTDDNDDADEPDDDDETDDVPELDAELDFDDGPVTEDD